MTVVDLAITFSVPRGGYRRGRFLYGGIPFSRIVWVRETRVTGMLSHILIGLSLLLLPYPLGFIPSPVLNGLFLYMGDHYFFVSVPSKPPISVEKLEMKSLWNHFGREISLFKNKSGFPYPSTRLTSETPKLATPIVVFKNYVLLFTETCPTMRTRCVRLWNHFGREVSLLKTNLVFPIPQCVLQVRRKSLLQATPIVVFENYVRPFS